MKNILLCLCAGLLLATTLPVHAQKQSKRRSIGEWVEQIYAQREAERLKSYYKDRQTADTCEAWYSCAKWAFEEYEKDQSFKIVRAELKTNSRVYRHRVIKEKHLFVEATYAHRIVRVEFITPKGSGRTRPYRYIGKFPQ